MQNMLCSVLSNCQWLYVHTSYEEWDNIAVPQKIELQKNFFRICIGIEICVKILEWQKMA